MDELSARQVRIDDEFWSPRLEMNAGAAIRHQWEQLEATGCLDNFRIAAGEAEGFREGWFFADSDAYKWLDAACRIQATHPSAELAERIEAFWGLLARAQAPDGYLYTYNQVHFPGQRWVNLQIEHELYCLGHLIEAGIADWERDRESGRLPISGSGGLVIARRAADLLVRELAGAGPECTDGHEEIELALIRLYRATGEVDHLRLAEALLEGRGRIRGFWRLILRQRSSVEERRARVRAEREAYLAQHPEHRAIELPPGNASKSTRLGKARYYASALSGRMLQQHRPLRQVTAPVGHAVRFGYLETAAAMLCRERGDPALRRALEAAWERMVRRRMYVTGGLGALPEIEGFGRDFGLDPEAAYAETCAALASLFWNWEMALLTREARYADLFEWQLYNAASVGMGADGTAYLYNNPLACRGGIERRAWFQVPCCPSNLSRTWAALGKYLFSHEGDEVWVHQYVGCEAEIPLAEGPGLRLRVESGLPWQGQVRIYVESEAPAELALHVRIPSWTRGYRVRVNGEAWEPLPLPPDRQTPVGTACGYAPHGAFYVPVRRRWERGDAVELELPMPIVVRRPHWRVRGGRGRAALTRGPLVYCLESVDNPGVDLFEARVELPSLTVGRVSIPGPAMAGMESRPTEAGMESRPTEWVLRGRTADGQPLTFIPYFAWANRGPSQMNVMVRV
jgi:DUF1680 family protein